MKIAQVCPRYSPYIGGVETTVKALSEELIKNENVKVDVLSTDPTLKREVYETINGVDVMRFSAFAPNDSYFISRSLSKYLNNYSNYMGSYDIIHAHSYHSLTSLSALKGCINDTKLVFSPYYHGEGHTFFRNLLHKPYRLMGKKIFDRADAIVCISEYEKELVSKHFGHEDKIFVIPVGIDTELYSSVERNPNTKNLLYVGRLEEYKGVQYIINWLTNLPDYTLTIVGSGAYEAKLREFAQTCGVGDRINWMYALNESALLEEYANATAFIMPSSHESYGISVAQALCAGIPCIVNEDGGALKEFINNRTCFGINVKYSAETFSNKLHGMDIHRDFPKANYIYNWKSSGKEIIDLYKMLLE
jgi:glycosyltransferase involved in cell wall biosynthesis